MLASFLAFLGFFTFISLFRRFYPFIAVKVFGPKKLDKGGKWAVVTGATDGIGLAYCQALAKRGMNIVLISRTLAKLQKCASDIETEYKVETKVVSADFGNVTNEGFIKPIEATLEGLDIGVLINNVGQSYEKPTYFADEDTTGELLDRLISLNVHSTNVMTKLVMPGMSARKGGVVISISSAAGVMTCGSPMLAGYSATKAYVAALSKSIQYEVASKGVICQVHAPYFVVSNMSKIRKASLAVPTPAQWVKSSLDMAGYGGTVIVPYFMHFIQDFAASLVPEELIGWYTCDMHQKIRQRWIKKQEREKKAAEKSE